MYYLKKDRIDFHVPCWSKGKILLRRRFLSYAVSIPLVLHRVWSCKKKIRFCNCSALLSLSHDDGSLWHFPLGYIIIQVHFLPPIYHLPSQLTISLFSADHFSSKLRNSREPISRRENVWMNIESWIEKCIKTSQEVCRKSKINDFASLFGDFDFEHQRFSPKKAFPKGVYLFPFCLTRSQIAF